MTSIDTAVPLFKKNDLEQPLLIETTNITTTEEEYSRCRCRKMPILHWWPFFHWRRRRRRETWTHDEYDYELIIPM